MGHFVVKLITESHFCELSLRKIPKHIVRHFQDEVEKKKYKRERKQRVHTEDLNIGMTVQAEYRNNKKYYDATVDKLLNNGEVLVTFTKYGIQAKVDVQKIKLISQNTYRRNISASRRRSRSRSRSRSKSRNQSYDKVRKLQNRNQSPNRSNWKRARSPIHHHEEKHDLQRFKRDPNQAVPQRRRGLRELEKNSFDARPIGENCQSYDNNSYASNSYDKKEIEDLTCDTPSPVADKSSAEVINNNDPPSKLRAVYGFFSKK